MLNNIMVRNKQNHNDSSVIINDNEVTDYQVIANKFNEYFSTVAEKLMEKIPYTNQNPLKYLENQPKSSLFLSATSPWEIKKMLNEIPSKYSSGWDDIPSVVVKKSPDHVLVARVSNRTWTRTVNLNEPFHFGEPEPNLNQQNFTSVNPNQTWTLKIVLKWTQTEHEPLTKVRIYFSISGCRWGWYSHNKSSGDHQQDQQFLLFFSGRNE